MNKLMNMWNRLSPKAKRIAVGGAGSVVALYVMMMFINPESQSTKSRQRDAIKHILTDSDTRDVGIDSLSADIMILEDKHKELNQTISGLKEELETAKTDLNPAVLQSQIKQLRSEITTLQVENTRMKNTVVKLNKQGRVGPVIDEVVGGETTQSYARTEFNTDDPSSVFENAPLPVQTITIDDGTGRPIDPANTLPTITIQTHRSNEAAPEENQRSDDLLFLPSGSILTGVLINGLDAPTSNGARKDPFPVLLRLQTEALLPNRYRADIRECFMLASGYGDLSSERAYLRGENISCIRTDEQVIETKLNSYVVGEDGKAGVRGRLVSKNGQIIAKSLMAGFLSGTSEAFDVDVVPVINTNPNSDNMYQSYDFGELAKGAGAKGAAKSLEMIAEYYLDMAESIFPVIEIDAGRTVDVIVTNGTTLNIRQAKNPTSKTVAKRG